MNIWKEIFQNKEWKQELVQLLETFHGDRFEMPVLRRAAMRKGMFMLHVDNILFCGQTDWWRDSVLPEF